MNSWRIGAWAALLLLSAGSLAQAQTLAHSVVGSGGGVVAGPGAFVISTVGQPVVGHTEGPETLHEAGYWATFAGVGGARDQQEAVLVLLTSHLDYPEKNVRDHIEKAVEALEESLDPELWIDADHVADKKVFDEGNKAAKELAKVLTENEADAAVQADVLAALQHLVETYRILAATALADAEAACDAAPTPGDREDCEQEAAKGWEKFGKAEEALASGDYEKAIDQYLKAWDGARNALGKDAGKGGTGADGVVTLASADVPDAFALEPNYPNPFNPQTTITFSLPEAVHARLAVFDVLGRVVTMIVDEPLEAGTHRARFDGYRLPSGTYFYRLTGGGFTATRTMLLMR